MLTTRSQEKELIDLGPEFYTQAEYVDCLKKLFRVNRWFGIFRNTRKAIARFPHANSLLDVACGGGLFILNLSRFYQTLDMKGLDINSAAIDEAQNTLGFWQRRAQARYVSFEHRTNPELILNENYDLILANFLCHHLSDDELVQFLKDAYARSRQGVIINDLHRHAMAQKFFSWFSPLLFNNRLISHDGLISIRRSFTRTDWKLLLSHAGIDKYQITWRFPFQWQIVLIK